jgi:Sec-independent protein translocase protein TatA
MTTVLLMFDVGAGEMMLVVLLAIMLYGGDLPDVARKTGAQIRKFRGVAEDLKRQVQAPPEAAEIKQVLHDADPRTELRGLDLRPELRKLDAPKAPVAPDELDEPAAPGATEAVTTTPAIAPEPEPAPTTTTTPPDPPAAA